MKMGRQRQVEGGRINTLSVVLLGIRPSRLDSVPVGIETIMADPVMTLCYRSSNRGMVQIKSAVK